MISNAGNNVLIREFNEDRDTEMVGRLDKNCEIGFNKEVSIFTNIMGVPLCRIRFYPLRVVLVAELLENGELVGVVRGCIKCVGTGPGGTFVKMGCILGLRVSPRHRRMGIGLKLVNSIEEWVVRNGAQYTFVAVEKNNIASTNLFTTKCNYTNISSLIVFVEPVSFPAKDLSRAIKTEQLHVNHAISLYNNRLTGKDIYPTDMGDILKEKMSLGTWVSYFKDEEWTGLRSKDKIEDIISRTPSSWVMFSIWNACDAYQLNSRPFKTLQAILTQARNMIFPCLKFPVPNSLEKTFGFLFLYGVDGEGERLGELMEHLWAFASRLAANVKACKVIITELGVSDPLVEHIPQDSSMSLIDDLWYMKKMNCNLDEEEDPMVNGQLGNVFVDPRDF